MSKSNKLTMQKIKEKLNNINQDIIIVDEDYENSKYLMNCFCLVCDSPFKKSWNDISSKNRGCPYCGKNGVKISKDEIREHVNNFGYRVVEFTKNDSNKGTMFLIECSEKHQYETSYREFNREEIKRHGSCKECNQARIGLARRKDKREVVENIKKWGYTTEENFTYKNSKEIHRFVCKNGHERNISYSSLEQTIECPECNGKTVKLTEDEVSKKLELLGLEYASGFINSAKPFIYKCSCGNKDSKTLYRLLNHPKCNDCLGRKPWTFDEVYDYFLENECELLSDNYINNKQGLDFKCKCGKVTSRVFGSFIKSPMCGKCGHKRASGENHPFWNPNLTDEERLVKRKYLEYKEWRNSVYRRDNYTCQCCGDDKGGNLVAHHLDGYDWAIELRVEINNGITLCEECHLDFHGIYGYGENTKEQFEEYLKELYDSAI